MPLNSQWHTYQTDKSNCWPPQCWEFSQHPYGGLTLRIWDLLWSWMLTHPWVFGWSCLGATVGIKTSCQILALVQSRPRSKQKWWGRWIWVGSSSLSFSICKWRPNSAGSCHLHQPTWKQPFLCMGSRQNKTANMKHLIQNLLTVYPEQNDILHLWRPGHLLVHCLSFQNGTGGLPCLLIYLDVTFSYSYRWEDWT